MDTGPPHILAACEHGGGVHGCLGRMSKHALASPSISCDASLGLQHVACPCNDHVLSQSFECAFREARTPQLDATHGGRGAALLEALPTGCVPGCRLTPRTLFQRSGASAKSAVEGHLRAGFLLGLGAQVERFATSGSRRKLDRKHDTSTTSMIMLMPHPDIAHQQSRGPRRTPAA